MATEISEPAVVVIVITHNGKNHLQRCLPSLFMTSYANYQVWLVDNASTDGTAEYVGTVFPNVVILRHPENFGFARGNNVAMELALKQGADYICLLNDDTEILDPRWLSAAVGVAVRDKTIGVVGFLLTGPADSAQLPRQVSVTPVTAVEGCAILLSAELLRNVGLFDEVYFAYAEESDLEMRATRAGYRMAQVNAPVFHLGGGTSQRIPTKRTYLVMRNVIRHSIKNRDCVRTVARMIKTLDIGCNPFPLFFDISDVTHQKIRGKGNLGLNFCLYCAAVAWNVYHLPQTLRIRHHENRLIRDTQLYLSEKRHMNTEGPPTARNDEGMLGQLFQKARRRFGGRPPRAILELALKVGPMYVRGLWWKLWLRQSAGLLLVGNHVSIRNPECISVGTGFVAENSCEIQGLSQEGITFGKSVTIGSYAMIRPSGYYGREIGVGLNVGNNSNIGPYCFIGCSGRISIGNNVMMSPRVSIYAEDHNFDRTDVPMKEQGVTRGETIIEDDCWLASNCVILSGTRIGRGAVVAAGSVVNSDVLPFAIVAGVPARIVKMRVVEYKEASSNKPSTTP